MDCEKDHCVFIRLFTKSKEEQTHLKRSFNAEYREEIPAVLLSMGRNFKVCFIFGHTPINDVTTGVFPTPVKGKIPGQQPAGVW